MKRSIASVVGLTLWVFTGLRGGGGGVIPEPSSLVTFTGLLAMGLMGYGWRRWRGRA